MPQTDQGQSRDFAAIALAYAKGAVADRYQRTHGKWVRLAAQRHLDDLKRSRRRAFEYRFSEWHANDVCDFIEKLPHVEGVWKHPNIILEPFQIFVLVCVFGWRRKDNGYRRFTVVYEEVARKNAKSTKTAGISLYCLCCEGEVGPQVLTAATTYDQAKKVFHPAKRMVEKLPELQEAFGVTPWAKSITCADNGGYMQPIHAKSKTQDGHNPHLVTMDELHAHEDRGLYDVMRSSQGQRINPLFWQITTAGFNLEGICFEQRGFAIKVLQREFAADHVFAIIFTLDRAIDYSPPRKADDDPYEEANWIKSNPLLAAEESASLRNELRRVAIEAKEGTGGGDYLTKHMNLWVGAARAWLNSVAWEKRADPGLRLKHFKGLDCYIGADLSDKDDITALTLAALDPNGRLLVKSWFFVPEAALERTSQADRENVALYAKWKKARKLIVTPGDMVDQRIVRRKIRRIFKAVGAKRITFDQWGSQIIASDLNEDLSSPDDPVAFIMNKTAANVTPAAKEIEARVRAKGELLVHDDNPVMNWMVSNAVVDRRVNGSLLPKKPKAMSRQKIDGVDSMLNAVAPMVMAPPDALPEPSVVFL